MYNFRVNDNWWWITINSVNSDGKEKWITYTHFMILYEIIWISV